MTTCTICGCQVEEGPCPNCLDEPVPFAPTHAPVEDDARWKTIQTSFGRVVAFRQDILPDEVAADLEAAVRGTLARW